MSHYESLTTSEKSVNSSPSFANNMFSMCIKIKLLADSYSKIYVRIMNLNSVNRGEMGRCGFAVVTSSDP